MDKDTRFYLDIDIENGTLVKCEHGNRFQLKGEALPSSNHRVYISKGQFNALNAKLEKRHSQ